MLSWAGGCVHPFVISGVVLLLTLTATRRAAANMMLRRSPIKRAAELTLHDLPSNFLEAVLTVLQKEPCNWAAAAASCKTLYYASKATLPLPLLTVSPATSRRATRSRSRRSSVQRQPSLLGLWQALQFRQERGEGSFFRKLVVAPDSLSRCSQELTGVLQALAGQALPEALEIQWLGRWRFGDLLHPQHADVIQARLGRLTGLRQLHLQLQSTAREDISGLNVGVLSSLQRLEDLEVEFRSPHPVVKLERGPLASLTRLSITHTPPLGRSFVDRGVGLSQASIDPAHLPALRLLQLGSWGELVVIGVAIPDFQQEIVGAWRMPEVEVRGPAEDCRAVGLAPLALSVEAHLKLPELAYSHLTRLRLDRVCRVLCMHQGGIPKMPRLAELHLGQGVGVEMLEGPDAGSQEADLLIEACPTLSQVTGREGMLSYEQLKEAGGLGDMTEIDVMLTEAPTGPMNLEEANALFHQMLVANGFLDQA